MYEYGIYTKTSRVYKYNQKVAQFSNNLISTKPTLWNHLKPMSIMVTIIKPEQRSWFLQNINDITIIAESHIMRGQNTSKILILYKMKIDSITIS